MEYLGSIINNKDLVNKKFVEDSIQNNIDTTLNITNKSADAKVTGEAIVGLSDRTNFITNAINYDYDAFEDYPENPSSGVVLNRYGIKRELTQITLNSSNPSNYAIRIKISGGIQKASSVAGAQAWTSGIQLQEGRTYQVNTKFISGSITTPEGVNPPAVTVYKAGESTAITTATRDGFDTVSVFTAPAEEVNLVFYINANVALVNAKYQVILRDVSDVMDVDTKEELKRIAGGEPFLLKYGRGSVISASESNPKDLNDFITPGNFYITNLQNVDHITNVPIYNAGRLVVMSVNSSNTIMQIYIPIVQAHFRIYTRSKFGENEWSEWAKVLDTTTVDSAPTAGSNNLVSSGGVYDAINSMVTGDTVSIVPSVQPSSAGKIFFPQVIHSKDFITYAYNGDGITRKITQGICSDGKRYLFFPFKVYAGEAGDDEIPVMCKWDVVTNSPVLFEPADKSYGHIEDMCFVPAYVPGFDNGNVDRLYLVDMNRSTEAGETGTIHVISAEDLSFISSFATYDAVDDTKNLISKTFAPYWHGIYHVGYSPEREQFMVHSADNDVVGETTIHYQTLAIFNADGTLVKGLNFIRAKGTYCGFDCDANYLYTTLYISTPVDDVFNIYLCVFDWELNPVGTIRIDQMAWEIEGICHIGTDFYISWIKKVGSARNGILITKSSYIKNQNYSIDTTFPVSWLESVFNRNNFQYFIPA